jgi:hypothetical protein
MMNEFPPPFPLPDRVEFDAASLFPNGKFPDVGTVMDLRSLRNALFPANEPDFVESFIPPSLYVRSEMRQAFAELIPDLVYTKVFSGSPGIGKSILLILVAIYRAWTEDNRKITYLRYTKSTAEDATVFAMQRVAPGFVEIRFNRFIRKKFVPELMAFGRSTLSFMPAFPDNHVDLRAFVDGPTTQQAYRYGGCRYFCTSGSGMKVTNELNGTVENIVMGGWLRDSMKSAIAAQFNLQLEPHLQEGAEGYFNEDLFDEIDFVTGGRIRDVMNYYAAGKVSTEWADSAVNRISKQAAHLCLSSKDCRSTDSHMDSIRTLFRVPGGAKDKVDLIVDSQYMIRCLRDKIDGAEYFDAYHAAL